MSGPREGQTLVLGVDDTGVPCHVLDGLPVRSGTLLELRTAPRSAVFPRNESWLPVRYDREISERPDGQLHLAALGYLAVSTANGWRDVSLRLPHDAVLRWSEGTQAPSRCLTAAEADRLEQAAAQIECSSTALRAAYGDPRSGLDGLGRQLLRMDAGVAGETDLVRRLARQGGPVWPEDLAFLETLARRLEATVSQARRQAAFYKMSEAARSALQQEGGWLLIESGWLRELCARLAS